MIITETQSNSTVHVLKLVDALRIKESQLDEYLMQIDRVTKEREVLIEVLDAQRQAILGQKPE